MDKWHLNPDLSRIVRNKKISAKNLFGVIIGDKYQSILIVILFKLIRLGLYNLDKRIFSGGWF